MSITNNRNLILAGWAAVWVAAMGYYFYARHEMDVERRRAEAVAALKAAAEKEKQASEEAARAKERLQEQSKKLADLRSTKGIGGVITPEEEAAPISGLLGERPRADLPTPPIIAAAEYFINSHALTATSIDKTTYCVIDAHRYRIGDQIAVGPDQALRVAVIKDGYVIFWAEGYSFKMLLVLPK